MDIEFAKVKDQFEVIPDADLLHRQGYIPDEEKPTTFQDHAEGGNQLTPSVADMPSIEADERSLDDNSSV